ncbi:hypothetical protein Tco_0985935 [Tanacetum coccineum]
MACSHPHTDSKVEALVQRLINEDKGFQDVLLNLAFQFEDSCAIRDDLRKTYEKCNDISQESRALICTLLKESSDKDRKLHLSMYGKAAQLERQIGAKLAWFQEKYFGRTHGGLSGLELSEFDHDPQRVCPQHRLPLSAIMLSHSRSSSLAVTSSGLSSGVSDAGLPLEKVVACGYGYIKNHKKTVKNGQAWTQEQKSAQKPEAKVKPSIKFSQGKSNSGQPKSTTKRQNPK